MIFRLGRLLSGGARGPGVFFIIPCVDIYEKIDMRTMTYEIPPQEVRNNDIWVISPSHSKNMLVQVKIAILQSQSLKIPQSVIYDR